MDLTIDPANPFAALEHAGFEYKLVDTSSSTSFEINGIPLGGSTSVGERYEWKLPKQAAFEAGFAREGLGKKLVKIFKKELQTGDQVFDDIVYVSTSDKARTGAFLEDSGTRDTISDIVGEGGSIVVRAQRVLYSVDGAITDAQRVAMATLVARVGGA